MRSTIRIYCLILTPYSSLFPFNNANIIITIMTRPKTIILRNVKSTSQSFICNYFGRLQIYKQGRRQLFHIFLLVWLCWVTLRLNAVAFLKIINFRRNYVRVRMIYHSKRDLQWNLASVTNRLMSVVVKTTFGN